MIESVGFWDLWIGDIRLRGILKQLDGWVGVGVFCFRVFFEFDITDVIVFVGKGEKNYCIMWISVSSWTFVR